MEKKTERPNKRKTSTPERAGWQLPVSPIVKAAAYSTNSPPGYRPTGHPRTGHIKACPPVLTYLVIGGGPPQLMNVGYSGRAPLWKSQSKDPKLCNVHQSSSSTTHLRQSYRKVTGLWRRAVIKLKKAFKAILPRGKWEMP